MTNPTIAKSLLMLEATRARAEGEADQALAEIAEIEDRCRAESRARLASEERRHQKLRSRLTRMQIIRTLTIDVAHQARDLELSDSAARFETEARAFDFRLEEATK